MGSPLSTLSHNCKHLEFQKNGHGVNRDHQSKSIF